MSEVIEKERWVYSYEPFLQPKYLFQSKESSGGHFDMSNNCGIGVVKWDDWLLVDEDSEISVIVGESDGLRSDDRIWEWKQALGLWDGAMRDSDSFNDLIIEDQALIIFLRNHSYQLFSFHAVHSFDQLAAGILHSDNSTKTTNSFS